MKEGIKELKELVTFVAVLASAADKSTQDGLGYDDIGEFVNAMLKAPNAFEGIDKVGAEIKDLDAAEMQELKDLVAAELNLVDDKLELVVEKAIVAIVNIYDIVLEVKALKK